LLLNALKAGATRANKRWYSATEVQVENPKFISGRRNRILELVLRQHQAPSKFFLCQLLAAQRLNRKSEPITDERRVADRFRSDRCNEVSGRRVRAFRHENAPGEARRAAGDAGLVRPAIAGGHMRLITPRTRRDGEGR
jgi:hypothetical protein